MANDYRIWKRDDPFTEGCYEYWLCEAYYEDGEKLPFALSVFLENIHFADAKNMRNEIENIRKALDKPMLEGVKGGGFKELEVIE